jgi:hypothetical protein
MEQLTIPKDKALEIYKKGDANCKKLLEKIYGKQAFVSNIMAQVKDFKDACKLAGTTPEKELPYPKPKTQKQEGLNGVAMQWLIRDVLCQGWEPDYEDSSQPKYECIFNMKGGVSFSFTYTFDDFTRTFAGARLSFPNHELANYFGTQFISIHKIVLTKTKA